MSAPSTVQIHWARVRSWMARRAPEALAALRPPASPDGIAALEEVLGAPLPAEYREWLSLHDGVTKDTHGPFCERLLSAREVGEAWVFLRELAVQEPTLLQDLERRTVDAGLRAVWWHDRWIPISENGAGDAICLDLDPDVDGTRGQIVDYCHDWEGRRLRATGFGDLVRRHADALEAGEIVAAEEGLAGGFLGLLWRTSLTGSLADVSIRGESAAEGHERRTRYLRENPDERARRLLELLRRRGWLPERRGLLPDFERMQAVSAALARHDDTPDQQASAVVAAIVATGEPLGCTAHEVQRIIARLADPLRNRVVDGGRPG